MSRRMEQVIELMFSGVTEKDPAPSGRGVLQHVKKLSITLSGSLSEGAVAAEGGD